MPGSYIDADLNSHKTICTEVIYTSTEQQTCIDIYSHVS